MIEAQKRYVRVTDSVTAMLRFVLEQRAAIVALVLQRTRGDSSGLNRRDADDEDAVRLMTVIHAFDEHGL